MLELLLGFTLLTVAVFALFAVFPTGDKAVVRSVRSGQANEIARGIMEDNMIVNYSAMVDGVTTGEVLIQGMTRGSAELSTKFLYRVEIDQPLPDRNFKNIKVEVFWEEGANKNKHSSKIESSKGEYF